MPLVPTGEQLLATILKHASKATSYKFALLRALNDVVLGHPDLALTGELPVAVPLGHRIANTLLIGRGVACIFNLLAGTEGGTDFHKGSTEVTPKGFSFSSIPA